VRDGELPLKVGVLNPQLGEDPVLRAITWCPDWVVGSGSLFELDGERDEVAAATDVEQNEWSGDVAVISVTVNGRDVVQQRVVHQVHIAALTHTHTHTRRLTRRTGRYATGERPTLSTGRPT